MAESNTWIIIQVHKLHQSVFSFCFIMNCKLQHKGCCFSAAILWHCFESLKPILVQQQCRLYCALGKQSFVQSSNHRSCYVPPAECSAAAGKHWAETEAAERPGTRWSCPTGHQRPRWSHIQVRNSSLLNTITVIYNIKYISHSIINQVPFFHSNICVCLCLSMTEEVSFISS